MATATSLVHAAQAERSAGALATTRVRASKRSAAPPQHTIDGYLVEDHSLLIGFYRRLFWDRLTAAIPREVHPNVLTIGSQVFALLALAAAAVAVGYERPVFFALSAFGLMGALTLDNVDGAHARRTHQCSALGELLDHGLDGITSAATLIIMSLVLHLDAVMTTVVCTLGAVAFATVFWEQFRTGILILPKVSPTEGVTLLAIWELIAAVFHDPWWLRFSFERVTAGTVVVGLWVLVHIIAITVPFVRAAKMGIKGYQMIPLFVMVGFQIGFAILGARAIIPAVTIGLIAASLTCRMILMRSSRHARPQQPILSPALYLASVPALICMAVDQSNATGWALVSLFIVSADYAWSLWQGGSRLLRNGGNGKKSKGDPSSNHASSHVV